MRRDDDGRMNTDAAYWIAGASWPDAIAAVSSSSVLPNRMPLHARSAPRVGIALHASAFVVALIAHGAPRVAGAQQPSWSAEHRDESLRPELDAITARGRLLAQYDQASWHATDAVMVLRPDTSAVRGYLARRRSDGLWEVVFGRLDGSRENFLIAYRAVQRGPGETSYTATTLSPREGDADWYARAARALDVARGAFGSVSRPYNAMVIPASADGDWFVYVVPASTRPGVYPHGGDARYHVSRDGRTLIAQRRLHNAVLEYAIATAQGQRPVAGSHTAVLDDRPEDTDVFHVLSREPKLPEYIASKSYFFRVDVDGRITAFRHDGKGN
jgi:hypothetical protein